MYWNTYFVLKPCKQGVRLVCLELSTRTKVNIIGNLPELYHGMAVKCCLEKCEEYHGTYITYRCMDYEINLNDKNKMILEENGVDLDEYERALDIHCKLKSIGFTWKAAKTNLSQLYDKLPFAQADKIHQMLVNDPTDKARIDAIKKNIISMGRMQRKISYRIDEYLSMFEDIEKQGAYNPLMVALKIMCLKSNEYGIEKNLVYDNELREKEDFVYWNIQQRLDTEYELMRESQIERFVKALRDEGSLLVDEQLKVLDCLSNNLPCIVTGGAGVGKTSVIKAVLDCYTKFYSKKNILLLAPTGKASRRLAEKTGFPASTIHKALRKSPEDNFTYYNGDNPLPHRLIVVDESSMIDIELMYDLLSALEESAKIIFVGDHNQLCPVGYGEPFLKFFDMLKVFRLTQNHRQEEGTDILLNANAVLEDKPIHSGRGITINHIDFMDIGDILDKEGHNGDVQLLSPYNALNDQINSYLRIGDATLQNDMVVSENMSLAENGSPYTIGDKVMTIRNTKKYCNGDIGYVVRVAKSGNITVDIEGKNVCIKKEELSDLTFAYAITIHKMQGSEADKVVVFLPENDAMINKHMMYTAITRARKELEIYYYTTA